MTTRPLHRTIRLTLVSAVLALAVFSFVALGSGSAHAMSRQAASTGNTTIVRIVAAQNGTSIFRPSAVTIPSGSGVRIKNTTPFALDLRFGSSFYLLDSGASLTLSPLTQSMEIFVCAPHSGALPITVV